MNALAERQIATTTPTPAERRTPRPVPTCIAGGEALFRAALRRLLDGSGLTVTRSTPSLAALLAAPMPAEPPGLVLLLELPTADATFTAALAELRRRWPEVKLVVLSAEATADRLAAGLALGVDAFLLPTVSREVLVRTVALIMLGQNLLPARLIMSGTAGPLRRAAPVELPLTPRERALLNGLAAGQPNKVIGRHLGVTAGTVKVQLRRLMRKIGVGNRTQAAVWACERGFPQPDAPDPASAPPILGRGRGRAAMYAEARAMD